VSELEVFFFREGDFLQSDWITFMWEFCGLSTSIRTAVVASNQGDKNNTMGAYNMNSSLTGICRLQS